MKKDKSLSFEVIAPAGEEAVKVIRASVAGVLRDFGVDENDGRTFADALARRLEPSLKGSNSEGSATIHCLISRNGQAGNLKLWCEPECSLEQLSGISGRKDGWSRLIQDVSFEETSGSFSIKLTLT